MVFPIRFCLCLVLSLLIMISSSSTQAQTQAEHRIAINALLDFLAYEYASTKALDQDRFIAEEGILQAQSAHDTTLDFTLNANGTLNRVHQKLSPSGPTTKDNYGNQVLSAQLNLNKRLYDWGLIDKQIHQAEQHLAFTKNLIRQGNEKLFLNGMKAYFATLRSMARRNIREQSIDNFKSRLEEVKQRVVAGIGTQSEVTSAEASLALGISNLRSEEAGYFAALNNLKIFAPQGFEKFLKQKAKFPNINDFLLSISLKNALEQQQDSNPILASALAQINVAEAQYKASGDSHNPQLNLNLNVNQQKGYGYSTSSNTTGSASINFFMPLINGRSFDSQVRSAKKSLDKARLSYRASQDQQSSLLKQAWYELSAFEDLVNASQLNIIAQEDLLERAEAENNAGRTSFRVLLDQYDRVLDAKLQHIESLYTRLIKGLDMISLMGINFRKII